MKRGETEPTSPNHSKRRRRVATPAAAAATAAAAAAVASRRRRLLVQAADRNDLTAVQRLLQHESSSESNVANICNVLTNYEINPDAYVYEEVTALQMASYRGHVDIVRYLLRFPSCDVNITTRPGGETALTFACRFGHENVVEELLQRGNIRVDVTGHDGDTALHCAVCAASLPLTRRLCRHMQERWPAAAALTWINQPDHRGRTALYNAVDYGEVALVQYLLANGADISRAEEKRGLVPLHVAIVRVDAGDGINESMMELVPLLLNNIHQTQSHQIPSPKLCSSNNDDTNENGELDAHDNNQEKRHKMVNAADHWGQTALYHVVRKMSHQNARDQYNNLSEVLQLLLDHGADPSRPDLHGWTVIHKAVEWDLQDPVLEAALRRLLKHAVGMGTPSVTSVLGGMYDTILDLRDNAGGLTAMHMAVQGGREKALLLLLDYGARANSVSNREHTILHDAVYFTRGRSNLFAEDQATSTRMVRIILQHLQEHGDLFRLAMKQDNTGNTALHVPIRNGNIATVRLFCGDEPWARLFTNAVINNRGETPLHGAVLIDNVEILSFLLEHKADPSIRDASERTPLTLACELGHLNSIFVLFMHGQGTGLRIV